MTITYYLDLATIARVHADHARRKQQARMWRHRNPHKTR